MSFQPYQEAEKVDKLINRLNAENPPTKENLGAWTLYHRTIQSTLNLIEKKLQQVANEPEGATK